MAKEKQASAKKKKLPPLEWKNVRRKLGDLKPWDKNPRTIDSEQGNRLNQSLDEFNQSEVFLIGPDNELYDGHQRLKQWIEKKGRGFVVDCRQSNRPLTERERKKLVIFLHKGAQGEFDKDKLKEVYEFGDLLAWGFDKDELLKIGFDAPESDSKDAEPEIDRAAELLEKWQVRTGDLFAIGEHKLLCGDSTKREDVERVMGGEKAEACVTDSPYGINREGIENDEPEGLRELFDGVLENMPIENGVIINFQSPRLFPVWLDAIRTAGHKFERVLWLHRKAGKSFPWRGWVLVGDPITVSSIGVPEWGEPKKHEYDCYIRDELEPQELDGLHTTIKPLGVVQDLIEHTAGVVYEPFCGSGTTLVACQNLGRRGRAIEISPAYCSVILERMAAMGLTPKLVK